MIEDLGRPVLAAEPRPSLVASLMGFGDDTLGGFMGKFFIATLLSLGLIAGLLAGISYLRFGYV